MLLNYLCGSRRTKEVFSSHGPNYIIKTKTQKLHAI